MADKKYDPIEIVPLVPEVIPPLMKPMGRPQIPFNQDYADNLCAVISQSNKSLATIVKGEKKNNPNSPCMATVQMWLRTNVNFLAQYTRAKDDQADFLAEEIIEIADDSSDDEIVDDNGRRSCNNEFVNRSRLRVEARKWVASKLKPKKYGERMQLANDPDNPLGGLSDEQLEQKLKELMDRQAIII